MENNIGRPLHLVALAALGGTAAGATDRLHPTVVEEFRNQGCNSWPPANANLNAIAGDPDVLALSFSVTYWDNLGWKDTFAKPAYTQRQWGYARARGPRYRLHAADGHQRHRRDRRQPRGRPRPRHPPL